MFFKHEFFIISFLNAEDPDVNNNFSFDLLREDEINRIVDGLENEIFDASLEM